MSFWTGRELTAEMAAAFLCGHAGIENQTIDSSASYIANWYGRLQKDRKLLIHAASAAQKAADYILGQTPPPDCPQPRDWAPHSAEAPSQ